MGWMQIYRAWIFCQMVNRQTMHLTRHRIASRDNKQGYKKFGTHISDLAGLLQAFLRCRGLALDGCCVVRQSQVTQLADANSKSCKHSADLNMDAYKFSLINTDQTVG